MLRAGCHARSREHTVRRPASNVIADLSKAEQVTHAGRRARASNRARRSGRTARRRRSRSRTCGSPDGLGGSSTTRAAPRTSASGFRATQRGQRVRPNRRDPGDRGHLLSASEIVAGGAPGPRARAGESAKRDVRQGLGADGLTARDDGAGGCASPPRSTTTTPLRPHDPGGRDHARHRGRGPAPAEAGASTGCARAISRATSATRTPSPAPSRRCPNPDSRGRSIREVP
jgi:hypothetical protein